MIENIDAGPKGQADVSLLIGIDDDGNLNATATDKSSGEYQSLSVSLESIGEDGGPGIPDFELSDEELTLEDLSADDDEIALDESASELSLDEVMLEEDPSLDHEAEPSTDTLAATDGSELAGVEEFSEEAVAFDDSLSEEDLEDELASADELSADDVQAESIEDTGEDIDLAELGEGMVEADLQGEDFSFDDAVEPDENLFEEGMEDLGEESFSPDIGEEIGAGTGDEIVDELSSEEFSRLDSAPDESAIHAGFGAAQQPLTPRRSNAIIFVGYVVLALAALGVLTYLVFRLLEGPPAPPLRAGLPLVALVVPGRGWLRSLFRRAPD
jgi:hypothetical protein